MRYINHSDYYPYPQTADDVSVANGDKGWHRLAILLNEKGVIDDHEFLECVDEKGLFSINPNYTKR